MVVATHVVFMIHAAIIVTQVAGPAITETTLKYTRIAGRYFDIAITVPLQILMTTYHIHCIKLRLIGIITGVWGHSNHRKLLTLYNDVIMGSMTSQITSLATVYSTVHSRADKKNPQGSASLAFVRGIHRWPVNSPHKEPVMRKMFPSDSVNMTSARPKSDSIAIATISDPEPDRRIAFHKRRQATGLDA